MKKKIIAIAIIGMFLLTAALSSATVTNTEKYVEATLSNNPANSNYNEYTPHDPIVIDGNGDFTSANGVTGGSGTQNDPYIIEGWEIDVGGEVNKHGIYVLHTTDHFIIRNCWIHDVRTSGNYFGVYFEGVENGDIINCEFTQNLKSIFIWNFCSNIEVENCIFDYEADEVASKSDSHIWLCKANNVEILDNNLKNANQGIVISGNHITISDNEISDMSDHSILSWPYMAIYDYSNNIITNNVITLEDFSSSDAAIWIRETDYNTVYNNEIIGPFIYGIYLSYGHDNIIHQNIIKESTTAGLFIHGDPIKNKFTYNTFEDIQQYVISLNGVYLQEEQRHPNQNEFHHNNFMDSINTVTANYNNNNDNYWDDGSEGNYWADYTGEDNDGDGIGDTPHNIAGINLQDIYPLMNPVDPLENTEPNNPTIDGPTSGKIGVPHTYDIATTDPDEDDVYYYIDWGDGANSGWVGRYDSGVQVSLSHSWSKEGLYIIKVKAKDTLGAESDWIYLGVTMPRNRAMQMPLLKFLEQHPILYQLLQRFLQL